MRCEIEEWGSGTPPWNCLRTMQQVKDRWPVYSIIHAGRERLGARQLLHDLGWERASFDILSDASAACSAIARWIR